MTEAQRAYWNAPHKDGDEMVSHIFTNDDGKVMDNELIVAMFDIVFRDYVRWLRAAENSTSASMARRAVMRLVSTMILEAGMRMGGRNPDGQPETLDQWIAEFVMAMHVELVTDLKAVMIEEPR